MSTGSEFGGPPAVAASGDAGQDYLSSLLDNPLDTAGAQKLNEGAQQFKKLAENGSFAVNEAGFRAYEKVCDEFLDGYSNIRRELQALANAAQMGSSDYAKHIANFNVKVATGDDQALLPNLELLKNGFEQVKEALAIARKNYDSAEDANQQSLTKLHGDH
ncbi:hypothetical protein [Amycolatopsis sp. PS_44_ISF1]|uniref:hypothetical protein n=1 Tax=Amycolatopsis sp. PS_44_ISF1 TaxID=2974917 RepID=UPI0028DEB9BF|nr:hypothetical protein [Amycolatopsis sp. PS_44_ISF1]MDT8911149.1 hypothetical protein [Amycolatopsis sp. PS_44_ISF1]